VTDQFPQQVLESADVRGGLQFLYLGEDAEHWVFLGHPYHRDVLAAAAVIAKDDGYDWTADELPERSQLDYTWAKVLTACEDHGPGRDGHCWKCRQFDDEGAWVLVWHARNEDSKVHRGEPGFFPIVLWEADA
jgi:hypothetical protein